MVDTQYREYDFVCYLDDVVHRSDKLAILISVHYGVCYVISIFVSIIITIIKAKTLY